MKGQRWRKGVVALAMGTIMMCSIPVNAQIGQVTEEKQIEKAENVYEADLTISSARELKEFAQKVNSGNSYEGKVIKLTQNIQFDGVSINNFTPIGYFQGTFDGCGYTISGIDVTNISDYKGLFGHIGEDGTVKNVIVKDSQFSGCDYRSGSIAGYNEGMIDNCHNRNTTVSDDTCGGIAGRNYRTIINCSSTGKVTGAEYAGGIVGHNNGNISNSCNVGNIQSNGDGDVYLGGIAGADGYWGSGGTIQNCYNTGNIIVSQTKNAVYGGIIGYEENGIIANCYCSEESAESNFGSMLGTEKNNKALLASVMQTTAFVNQLNANRGDNSEWLEWEIRSEESTYPLTVERVNLSKCKISLSSNQMEYNGASQMPGITITYDGEKLELGKDYTAICQNNINVGNASVVMQGLGRYMDSTILSFKITSRNITKTNITISSGSFVYDGKAKTPLPVVKDGNRVLKKDSDYTVTYKNNTNAGTAYIIISGKGNYAGSVTKTFKIKKAEQSMNGTTSYKVEYGKKTFKVALNRKVGDGKVTYSSSNPKVIKVDNTGKASVKGMGRAVIMVKAAATTNYNAKTVKITVNIVPKKQVISYAKSTKAKTITAKWKKDKDASGYILQCSTDRKFKKNVKTITISKNKTTSKKISGLTSGKKYYVRVCSYKKVSGSKIQGDYSTVKTVQVKK